MQVKLRSIKYYIKEGFRSLIKNRLMSIASIVTVAVCIFMVIVSYCVMVNIDYMLKQVENTIGISAFAEKDLNAEQLNSLLKEINQIPHVSAVEYISPEEGLKSMQEELGDDEGILEGYEDDNPLSSCFSITVDEAKNQKAVVKELEKLKSSGISNVRHALTVTDALINMSKIINVISFAIIGVLCIVSIIIIVNTIKLAVYIRRTEINIMKYVGATDWFIRWPFIIEGTMIGIIGAIIPVLLCMFFYSPVIDKITSFPIVNQLLTFKTSIEIFQKITPISVIVGIVIGTFGSTFSIHKHLQV